MAAFNMMDKNQNKKISTSEILLMISKEFSDKDVEEVLHFIRLFDINRDGELDLFEFIRMMYKIRR